MISPYSIPAILAFLAKLAILRASSTALIQDKRAKLFRVAVALSLGLNIAEFILLQKFSYRSNLNAVTAYYAISVLVVPVLVHLAISISIDRWDDARFRPIYFMVYGPGAVLATMFIFATPLLVVGVEDLRGYSVTGIRGPFFDFYEVLLISSFLTLLALPIIGLRRRRRKNQRDQCKLWLAATVPLALLVITVIILLKLNVRWFNVTVVSPLLITLMFATIGYVIQKRPIIELDFYIPGSRTRKGKAALYRRLEDLGCKAPEISSLEELLANIASVCRCPVALVTNSGVRMASTDAPRSLLGLATDDLAIVRQLAVIDDPTLSPETRETMSKASVDAVIPFFAETQTLCFWLVCGQHFSSSIYSSLDFRELRALFEKLSGLLLELTLIGRKESINSNELASGQTLQQRIAELEASSIRAALAQTNGNKAQAARLLGLKANTFHYKLRRYGL